MKIVIEMEVPDEMADPSHEMGITEDGYGVLMELLMEVGENISIRKAE